MNRSFRASLTIAAFCAVLWTHPGPAFAADTVDTVLARMNEAAPKLHAMTADVSMITYSAVIDDKSTENGKLQMQKIAPNDVRAIIAFQGASDARTIALMGRIVEIYYPRLNTYQKYDLGGQSQMADQLLLLGFGSSGTELAQSYDIRLAGQEKVGAQDTSKIELTPKDAEVRKHVAKVFLWIPVDAGYPVQQQFFDPPPSGNWRKVTYSNIDLHPDIHGALELKLPKNAKPQKD